MGFPFSRLNAVALFLGQPPGIAALISIGFHGVLFTAGPTFSSAPLSGGGAFYGLPPEVPLVELTPQEQGKLPDFSSPFLNLPDVRQHSTLNGFDNLPDPGSDTQALDIPENVITRYDQRYLPPFSPPPYSPPFVWEPPQNFNRSSPFPNTVLPENVSPAPTIPSEVPSASTPTAASTPGTASTHISASTPTIPSRSATDSLPRVGYRGLTAAILLPSPEETDSSSAAEIPPNQEAHQQTGGDQADRGSSPSPNIPTPLLAWRESLNYNSENTTIEAAETAQTEWLSALKETTQDPGIAVTETIALPLTYKNSICLDPQPDSGLVGFWLAPAPEDQAPLKMLKSTGYPFLNRQMLEHVANALVEMDLSQAPGNAVYLFDISFSMEPDSCRSREEILSGTKSE